MLTRLVAIFALTLSWAAAPAAQASNGVLPGETVRGAWRPQAVDAAVPLPRGEWLVAGRQSGAGGRDVALVLARVRDGRAGRMIWARASHPSVSARALATWCDEARVVAHLARFSSAGARGCRWTIQWGMRPHDPSIGAYWREAFGRLQARNVEIPLGMLAAGFHLRTGDALVTVVYLFDAKQADANDIRDWARSWRQRVIAALRERRPQTANLPSR